MVLADTVEDMVVSEAAVVEGMVTVAEDMAEALP